MSHDDLLDDGFLDYDFDEESIGFGEPAPAAALANPERGRATQSMSAGARVALALVVLGLLSLIVQLFGGPLSGTWPGFASAFGGLALGGALYFWFSLRETSEGIKHDGTFFSSLTARGGIGWIAGILMTGLYVLLYFQPRFLGYIPAVYGPGGKVVDPARVTGGLDRSGSASSTSNPSRVIDRVPERPASSRRAARLAAASSRSGRHRR